MIKKAALIVFLLAAVGLTLFSIFEIEITRPNNGAGFEVFEIKKGESVQAVAKRLHKSGIISSPLFFEMESRLKGVEGKIHAGEYRLPLNLSARAILKLFIKGRTILHSVTIPEGLTLHEIAKVMEKSGLMNAEEFIIAASDSTILASFNLPWKNAEGYLFPETYSLPKGITPREAVKAMIKTFFDKVKNVLPENVVANPVELKKIVTLASIIEKETGAGHERKVISAVFNNRLRIGMRLQSDPTVIYAMPHFDGNIRKKDLEYDSPYNTYLYKGLPPGPIASPGLDSIRAALFPEKVDYLYFVSKNNGEHQFSRTLKEHNNAVKRYQIRRKN